jgi:hypothetical protein
VDGAAFERRSSDKRMPARFNGLLFHPLPVFAGEAMARGEPVTFSRAAEDETVARFRQSRGHLNKGVENVLQIEGRAADGSEDFAGGFLPLQRLRKFALQPCSLLLDSARRRLAAACGGSLPFLGCLARR